MKIETIEVSGFRPALHAMRNPMDSWAKSDSAYAVGSFRAFKDGGCSSLTCVDQVQDMYIGEADKALSRKLQKAGPEHCKHLRMIMVYADITAPRYWWTEFDTYRNGVEKVSCSTMHKLTSRPLTMDDFEHDSLMDEVLEKFIELANNSIKHIKGELPIKTTEEDRKDVWRGLIQGLPQSYLQKRTVMMSYAALRNIYRQREGHKLKEWEMFREWVRGLPESWMITE